MTDKTNGKKVVDTLGYTPEQYKLFTKNAWIVLLAFSLLYSILYCGRLNLQYTMPAMMAEEGWTELDLGILSSVLFWTYGIGHLFNGRLGEIFGVELKDRESVIPYAKKMQEMGATNVLVSMAGEGAVLAAADGKVYLAPAPKGKLVNGVGAGDSMVAGFLTGWLKRQDYREAFHMGIATGSASAFSEYLAGREQVEDVYRQVTSEVR